MFQVVKQINKEFKSNSYKINKDIISKFGYMAICTVLFAVVIFIAFFLNYLLNENK